jgi:hypothetical protein
MPTFVITGPDGAKYRVTAPEGATDQEVLSRVQAQASAPAAPAPQAASQPAAEGGIGSSLMDFVKSIPRGLIQGVTSLPNPSMVPIQDEELAMAPIREGAKETLLAQTHAPEGRMGKFGEAIGAGLGNPISWVGPGGPLLKAGGAILSSAASEGAGQATEGTAFEQPARIAAALAGGATAAKALGPSAPKAAVPKYPELKAEADRLYTAARNSGVEFHPQGISQFATRAQQELSGPNHGFTGGPHGDAPRAFAVLDRLQNPPPGATITASNVDALRKNVARLARETSEGKPTPDAAAASILLKRLNSYLEAPPPGHVVAGNADAYLRLTREANRNYAAGQKLRDWQTKLEHADLDASGQIAGSLENRTKIAARQILKSKSSRGLSQTEKAQLELINSGGPVSNFLRHAGRGGAGVIPLMGQAAAAPGVFAAGGLPGLAIQGTIAGALYGARKGSEAITKKRANDLVEMLAKGSPLYEKRVGGLLPHDLGPGRAAIARGLLGNL